MSSDQKLYPLDSLVVAFEALPHVKVLGLRCIDIERGSCLFELPYNEQLVGNSETGVVHGGAITSLLDSAGGAVAFTVVAASKSVATLDLRIDYLTQAAPRQAILGYANCYRQTQSVAFVKGYAYQDSIDNQIASFSASFMIGSVGFTLNAD